MTLVKLDEEQNSPGGASRDRLSTMVYSKLNSKLTPGSQWVPMAIIMGLWCRAYGVGPMV